MLITWEHFHRVNSASGQTKSDIYLNLGSFFLELPFSRKSKANGPCAIVTRRWRCTLLHVRTSWSANERFL